MTTKAKKKSALYVVAGALVFVMTAMVVVAAANTPLFAEKPIPFKLQISAHPGVS